MPSKRKKSPNKRTKTRSATAKRSKKASRAKQAAKPSRRKKASKKRQTKSKGSSSRAARRRKAPIGDKGQFSSNQRAFSGRQSGDLEGLSRAEQADSESVDELVEEGNAFEAGAVSGVEEADNADQREVHTHEVPEDDVPKEYLDEE